MNHSRFPHFLLTRNRFTKAFLTIGLAAAVSVFLPVLSAGAQNSFTAYGSKIVYSRPDAAQWKVMHDGIHPKSKAYLLTFQHVPIKDAQGREIEPVMALICESTPGSPDVIQYSISKRVGAPFDVNKVLTPQEGYFTHKNSVGYMGQYQRGSVLHRVIIGHLRRRDVGVQVICDSTDGVYEKVESDMLQFLRSVIFPE